MKKIFFHPLFRMGLIAMIIALLLVSCDGLELDENQTNNETTDEIVVNNKEDYNVQRNDEENDDNNGRKNPSTPSDNFKEKDLEYKGKRVALTHHARCRMDCREIDAFEIQEVINQNKINKKKSKPASGDKCPALAYEGNTRDGQEVRVIVGDCDKPIIITVIDLTNDYQCACK